MAQLTEAQAVRRAVDRLGFGEQASTLSDLQGQGWKAVAALLAPTGADAGVAATPAPTLKPEPKADKNADAEAKKARRLVRSSNRAAINRWWLTRMLVTRQPVSERLTWFWHGHFATSIGKVNSAQLMLQQNQTFRRLGRGSFTDLAHALIIDPALLIWLDGQKNTAKSANENLSREFMELFSLGHGNYSEGDVQQAARALTGWTINRHEAGAGAGTVKAVFRPQRHDNFPKTVLGTTANLNASDFVDLVLKQPASAAFVASRLWARLVSHTPPNAATLAALVQAYGSDRRIDKLVAAMISSDAFTDTSASLVKEPVIWLVGLLRAARIDPKLLSQEPNGNKGQGNKGQGNTSRTGKKMGAGLGPAMQLIAALKGMGQVPFLPPTVGGWPTGQGWLSTATMATRLTVARAVATASPLTKELTGSASARVTAVGTALGVDGWSQRSRDALTLAADQPVQLLSLAACSPEYIVSR